MWDYIVIGAGSAGCAVVHELVQAGQQVLLLEAGGADSSPYVRVAAGQVRACALYDWGYRTEPDPTRNGVQESWLRGRVLGGSSSINGTMYTRGVARDFDHWNLPGWTWNDVLPVFQRLECSDQPGLLRGHEGLLYVRTVKHPHQTTRAFVDAARAAGYPFNADYNGETQEGVGYAQMSQRGRFRCSSADAFVKPLLGRKNLELLLNAYVTRIEVSGDRATAVQFVHENRQRRETARGIVLCGGAINSPKLLMLSGIGELEELKSRGIECVCNLPGVGLNLKEQPMLTMMYRMRVLTSNLTGGIAQKLSIAGQFLMTGEGPLTNLFEGSLFARSAPSVASPDLQVLFMTFGYVKEADGGFRLAPFPSVSIIIMNSYPKSTGRIRLASDDPARAPLIECRLLDDPSDAQALIGGIEEIRRIMKGRAIADLVEDEVEPGAPVRGIEALNQYVRAHATNALHPVGTCRMGIDLREAVVGPDLRVHGLQNLWVADASVVPDQLSANLNAVCLMIGTKLGMNLASSSSRFLAV